MILEQKYLLNNFIIHCFFHRICYGSGDFVRASPRALLLDSLQKSASLAVALYCGIGSSFLKADVKARYLPLASGAEHACAQFGDRLKVQMHESRTVVFADILGFADLVMASSEYFDALDGFFYSNMSKADLRDSLMGERPEDPLTRTFAAFHRLLDIRVSQLMNADPVQTIIFSDSAFVVFRDLNTAMYFAQSFMRDLISFRIPARMGIGQGTFRNLRLTTDVSDEVRRHSAQFLGTGVIRATRAESCGLKGLRIFIHPDSKIIEDWPGDLCSLPDAEDEQRAGSKVVHELNYLIHEPDFSPTATGPQTLEEANSEIFEAVNEMMEASPTTAKKQYERTLSALERMLIAYTARR